MFDISAYKNKKVLVTGHTGFKGTWMCKVLTQAGANVLGYALNPPTEPSLFNEIGLDKSICEAGIEYGNGRIKTVIGDVRDLKHMKDVFEEFAPEIVIHMAAQPIVRTSYEDPVGTYEINVMGTVNVLECARHCKSVRSVVNVTTDKVYLNREWQWGYRENEELNGYDPYSNSKSCSELVTSSYVNSFFNEEIKKGRHIAVSTMRAGNVIGGGDFAKDRIVPDMVRAAENKETILVRNPYSTRPYQHVLEPVFAYLMVADGQNKDIALASNYNIGPDENDAWETGRLVNCFVNMWNSESDEKIDWKDASEKDAPHEANYLKLDCSKIKNTFNWKPVWNVENAIKATVDWTRVYFSGDSKAVADIMNRQIEEYTML